MSAPAPTARHDLLAAERGFVPARKSGALLSVALVYPNSYHVGMSSLGMQIAYRVINDHSGAVAERFFVDTAAQGSIESGTPLNRFDVIAMSGSFELDEPNILALFDSEGIPRAAADRGRGGPWPVIVMGGVLVSVNRLPLYPFFDAFIHGDAEVALGPVIGALASLDSDKRAEYPRRIEAIAGLPGIEVTPGAFRAAGMPIDPALEAAALVPPGDADFDDLPRPEAPPAVMLEDLDNDLAASQILTPHTEFSDMALVDLARGCPHHCTFCWIGHNTPAFRQRSIDTIVRAIEAREHLTDRFGLVSSAVGAHDEIDEICRWMMGRGLKISYSSLRVEEVTPTMLEALVAGGQKSITIAPEAGNPRVRKLLGKKITDEQILDVVGRAMSLGVENVKLYTMIGIPSETDDEALDIVAFSLRVREVMLHYGRPRGRIGQLGINLGVFVPKPNLPLNHIEPVAPADLKRRLKKVVRALGKIPNSRVNVSSPELAVAQSILSMGGLEAARYIELVTENGQDWRRANRQWKAETDWHYDRHRRASRLSAERLRDPNRTVGLS